MLSMKLEIKGDLAVIGRYDVIQGIYMILPQALKYLGKIEINNRKELKFSSTLPALLNYKLRLYVNLKTNTIIFTVK